jgi:hypothetical protein
MTSRIVDFPLEIVAKVFSEMEVEDAWAARGVCRGWQAGFEMVAYGSVRSPLRGIQLGVDATSTIRMSDSDGETLDQHTVHGDLVFDSRKPQKFHGNRLASWVSEKATFEYWPGGKWRAHELKDVLTDVKVNISGLPTRTQAVSLRLGPDIGVRGKHVQGASVKAYDKSGHGKFRDFVLLVDAVDELACNGKRYTKHCIRGFVAPKWQIYALLVHHIKGQRELSSRLRRHYLRSYYNAYSHVMTTSKQCEARRGHMTTIKEGQWMLWIPRVNVLEIEC